MKKLLAIAILTLAAFTAQGQTTTNIAYTITIETVTAGVTNTANPVTFRYDYGAKKDALRIDGFNFAYGQYCATFGTNAPTLTFKQWVKQVTQALPDEYARQQQQAANAATLAKLSVLLTTQSDLLSTTDLNNLNTIAAKAP